MAKKVAALAVMVWLFAAALNSRAGDPVDSWIDRTTMFIPLDANVQCDELSPTSRFPDDAMDQANVGNRSGGWSAYLQVWKAHRRDPTDGVLRRFLGLPIGDAPNWSAKRSRTAPTWLRWKPGTYAEIDTPHFVIYSQADEAASSAVATDLERCYWVWTQMFFPLWEARDQVSGVFDGWDATSPVSNHLADNRGRITVRSKLKVVLFRDAVEYALALSRDVPGIERSTGFYSDARKAMCLYASDVDDAATRRHELVHQLFREATRSRLARSMPGERSGFWLVEGIAGYFESLFVGDTFATVGGWDSPRLQFGRYRTLVGGDEMSIDELQRDGRLAAQKRDDIARWYAHAITQMHRLIDGNDAKDRMWVYRELAKLYQIDVDFGDDPVSMPDDASTRPFLAVDDAVLIANRPTRSLESLCLAGCEVTSVGLASMGVQANLTWLDLARLPIGNDAVTGLVPSSQRIEQLTLEATRIDAGLATWLAGANKLRELDLSWTKVDDRVIDAVKSAAGIEVLWMTGTKITDQSIPAILGMGKLSSVDVQRTEITNAGTDRLRQSTSADFNPLQLRSAP
ncbi:hypothetical protein Poly51_11400 [Rubripirellula tenax]|uniref:Leucine Rich repeats (2 copies) n=1 Tax=Rubripirellula tenax TaxID=2528015 RepID=A0A5C6FHA4_9BACT|nr:hypothetical protein [Rubripirellula tenax]TWU60858.1 hypothetical protein Poly51_11400 [Rubripirellula tenax]